MEQNFQFGKPVFQCLGPNFFTVHGLYCALLGDFIPVIDNVLNRDHLWLFRPFHRL